MCIRTSGFPAGTPIETCDGDRPVESLTPGDKIVTRNGGSTPVLGIHAVTRVAPAVLFSKGALGPSGPSRDILLPADQPILVRDWRARALFGLSQGMATAGQLVDDAFVLAQGSQQLVLFRLHFDRPRVIYAQGLELGSSAEVMLPSRAVA